MNEKTQNKSLRSRLREESEAKAKFKRKAGIISLITVVIMVLIATTAIGVFFGIKTFDTESSTTKAPITQSKNHTKDIATKKSQPKKSAGNKKRNGARKKIGKPKDSKRPLNKTISSKKPILSLKTQVANLVTLISNSAANSTKLVDKTNTTQIIKKPNSITTKKSSNGPKGSVKKTVKISLPSK